MRKLNLEVSRLIMDIERANKWTNSSRIGNNLRGIVHIEKASLEFHKETDITEDLCFIYGKLGHATIECPVAANFRNRNTKLAKGNIYKYFHRNRSINL